MTSEITPEGTPVDPSAVTNPVDPSAVVAPAKKSKVRRNILLAGSAVGLVGIGSTLAANISLNGGNNVEFGQGVAKTTACDEDGFTINPVTSYDTVHSIFRLDRVEISGLNLTPVGTGYGAAGYNSQSDAKTAHPGEYFDPAANGGSGDWIRTCDGVVLDFKAYTDDTNYWAVTREGYSNGTSNDISTPVAWYQENGSTVPSSYDYANFGFAVKFDINDDATGWSDEYGVGQENNGESAYTNNTWWDDINFDVPANSSFIFASDTTYRPDAASISKIAVSSMATFPANYTID